MPCLRGAAGSNLSDGQWHTAVLASDTASGFDAYLAVDGNEILCFADTTGTNAKAFLKGISELDRLEIGGYTGASSVESGFKGDIEYVSISSQKLTKEQAKALSMESSANLRRDMFSNSTETPGSLSAERIRKATLIRSAIFVRTPISLKNSFAGTDEAITALRRCVTSQTVQPPEMI